jgi:hypothetical protein
MQVGAEESVQIFPGKKFMGKFYRGTGKYTFQNNIKWGTVVSFLSE